MDAKQCHICVTWSCLLIPTIVMASVKMSGERTFTVRTPAYTSTVEDDGCLTTLLVTTGSKEAMKALRSSPKNTPPPQDPEGPMWDAEALSQPPNTWPAEDFQADGLEGLFYAGPQYQGKPTRVFAWLGVPHVDPAQRIPGIVLVHGGGGTAFERWVRMWNERGYAAIAMDTCGCVPGGEHGDRPRHEFGGPPGWGGFDQIDRPRQDQWTYHAVAHIILAHSLLRSLPQVDPERTGITGISWGGYLTSIVAGVDSRFKLAVPVYGCGYYPDTNFAHRLEQLGEKRADRWMRWWDPSNYLPNANMPMFWVSGTNDFAYWLPALQESYQATNGPHTLSIRLRMPHGQDPGANPEEIRAFVDTILKDGKPLAKITGQGREGRTVWASFESEVPIVRAQLNFTKDIGDSPDREWKATEAQLEDSRATATVPDGTRVYYINIIDHRDLIVSTEHRQLGE